MSLIQEFKAFASRGNVIDMAVGIIIGAAFGKIVSSFVGDVIIPPIGLILGGVDFQRSRRDPEGSRGEAPGRGHRLRQVHQTCIDFLIISFAIFAGAQGHQYPEEEAGRGSRRTGRPHQGSGAADRNPRPAKVPPGPVSPLAAPRPSCHSLCYYGEPGAPLRVLHQHLRCFLFIPQHLLSGETCGRAFASLLPARLPREPQTD